MLAILLEITGTRCMLSWMRMNRHPKAAKIDSRPRARHWRSHKTVAEVDRSSAVVENQS
jgi:hypothetical protein